MTRPSVRRALLPALLIVAFAVLLALVAAGWGPLHRLDVRVVDELNTVARDHPGQVSWWLWVSRVLHPDVERACAAVAAVLLWVRGRRPAAVLVVVAMVAAFVLEAVVKDGVGRARPAFAHPVAHAPGGSFPSGHALTSVVAFGLLVLLVPRRHRAAAAVVAVVAVLLVGYSRIALGVHYPSDVLGGWLLGAACLVAAADLVRSPALRRLRRRIPHRAHKV